MLRKISLNKFKFYSINSTNHPIHHLFYQLFIILILNFKFTSPQFISTNNNDLQVNRPLERWEQFQKQLKLNQITVNPSPNNNFANHLSPFNQINNLDNLFTINPLNTLSNSYGNSIGNSPLGNSISILQNNNNEKPTVVLSTLPNSINNHDQPNSIFINNNDNPIRYSTSSNSPSSKFNLDQELRFTTNNAFLDSFKNKSNNDNLMYSQQSNLLNSSNSNSIQTKTHLDNFKELNHNLTRNHYIELSKKFMNLTLSITDSQFRGFLKFVHELSGRINSDCMSTLISLFYGLRRQQSWALKCKLSFQILNLFTYILFSN